VLPYEHFVPPKGDSAQRLSKGLTLYIHDVIGSLRDKYIALQRQIDEIRLVTHLLEVQLSALTGRPVVVSRETEQEVDHHAGDPTLF